MGKWWMLVALVGCAARAQFVPASGPVPPDAFTRAVRVMAERGHAIDTKDEAAGVIISQWDDDEFMGSKYRYRWTVTIASGTATVVSQCQTKINDPAPGQDNSWQTCDNQPDGRNAEAKAILGGIGK